MRLYDELFKNVDGFSTSRYTVIIGGGGYFEGVKAVGDFSPSAVTLYFPKRSILVEGERLAIKKYCDGDLEIAGSISAVKTLDENGKNKAEVEK